LLAPFNRYKSSGELNTKVIDQKSALNNVKSYFINASGSIEDSIEIDELDGLTISAENWWINLRPSNTEPLLRLNVEASTANVTTRLVNQVLDILKKQ
jgi:phosphomannomutase